MMFDSPKVFAVKHKDLDVRMNSRSGGIFTALTDWVLEQNGSVYGCALDENFEAVHIRAISKEERDRMRGSKYVQSKMNQCFSLAKEDLEEGKYVLFSGTSCQISGLKGFLGKEYERLVCVDIVCHGVPSPLVWRKYLQWMEKKEGMKVASVDFRNKREFGWEDHVESITLEKNGQEKTIHSSVYTTMFVDHASMRPACYRCPYKDIMHPADITIADYWGIDEAAPGFNDHKGVSLVLINNEKGENLFDQVMSQIQWKSTKMEDSMQPPLKAPFPKPANREKFWKDFYQKDFEYMTKVYGGRGLKIKTKVWIAKRKTMIKNILKGKKPNRKNKKQKVGIVTLVHVRNLGAGLQAYAMQHLLNKMGCDVVFLKGYGRKTARELFSWDMGMKFPSGFGPGNLKFAFGKIVKFEKSFRKFKEVKITTKAVKSCDRIILGSDSIWMPKVIKTRMHPSFFGALPHEHISSYAASAGGNNDSKKYTKSQKEPLKKLEIITVRDEGTQKLVKDVTGRNVPVVLDPTLIVDWMEVLHKEKMDKRPIKEKYVLLYGWFPDEAKAAVKAYADKHHLKRINVGFRTGGADVVMPVSPLEFVQYVAYSEGIVTCMFHGVMLSIALKKQFVYLPLDKNRDKKVATTMDRMDVAKETYYWDWTKDSLSFNTVDYKEVESSMNKMIKESQDWVKMIVEGEKL